MIDLSYFFCLDAFSMEVCTMCPIFFRHPSQEKDWVHPTAVDGFRPFGSDTRGTSTCSCSSSGGSCRAAPETRVVRPRSGRVPSGLL